MSESICLLHLGKGNMSNEHELRYSHFLSFKDHKISVGNFQRTIVR